MIIVKKALPLKSDANSILIPWKNRSRYVPTKILDISNVALQPPYPSIFNIRHNPEKDLNI